MNKREFRSGTVVPVGVLLLVVGGVLAGVRISQSSVVPAAAVAPAAARYLNLSVAYDKEKRYADSVDAARQAIALQPDFAMAWNNLAVGYANLGQWNGAIAAAREAIQLKPDFQLAKNNLAWALAEQARAARGK